MFFDDKSGLTSGINCISGGISQRGVKRERDEDDAIGLSLDGDESTPVAVNSKPCASDQGTSESSSATNPAPLSEDAKSDEADGGNLKRAYDDALAARGLIAVRRSCEKLTDLALPAKMQRTLSQEYIRQHVQGQSMGSFFSNISSQNPSPGPASAVFPQQNNGSQPYTTQHMGPSLQEVSPTQASSAADAAPLSDPGSVEVPSTTKCALCCSINVDTQLRPCGHMFHGRCLKPSLQNAVGPPKCPFCNTPMQSAILAVPSMQSEVSVALSLLCSKMLSLYYC